MRRSLLIAVPAGVAIYSTVLGLTLSARWLWVAGLAAVAVAAEVYAVRRRHARNDELAAVIGGPLPDEIDLEWLELHKRPWSEEWQ